MNNEEHITENLALAEKALPSSLSEKEVKLVEEAAAEFRKVMRVGCTGCQYCMPCPAGVNIPSCFDWYNSRHVFKDKKARIITFTALIGRDFFGFLIGVIFPFMGLQAHGFYGLAPIYMCFLMTYGLLRMQGETIQILRKNLAGQPIKVGSPISAC